MSEQESAKDKMDRVQRELEAIRLECKHQQRGNIKNLKGLIARCFGHGFDTSRDRVTQLIYMGCIKKVGENDWVYVENPAMDEAAERLKAFYQHWDTSEPIEQKDEEQQNVDVLNKIIQHHSPSEVNAARNQNFSKKMTEGEHEPERSET